MRPSRPKFSIVFYSLLLKRMIRSWQYWLTLPILISIVMSVCFTLFRTNVTFSKMSPVPPYIFNFTQDCHRETTPRVYYPYTDAVDYSDDADLLMQEPSMYVKKIKPFLQSFANFSKSSGDGKNFVGMAPHWQTAEKFTLGRFTIHSFLVQRETGPLIQSWASSRIGCRLFDYFRESNPWKETYGNLVVKTMALPTRHLDFQFISFYSYLAFSFLLMYSVVCLNMLASMSDAEQKKIFFLRSIGVTDSTLFHIRLGLAFLQVLLITACSRLWLLFVEYFRLSAQASPNNKLAHMIPSTVVFGFVKLLQTGILGLLFTRSQLMYFLLMLIDILYGFDSHIMNTFCYQGYDNLRVFLTPFTAFLLDARSIIMRNLDTNVLEYFLCDLDGDFLHGIPASSIRSKAFLIVLVLHLSLNYLLLSVALLAAQRCSQLHLSFEGSEFHWDALLGTSPSGMLWDTFAESDEEPKVTHSMTDSKSSTQNQQPAILRFRFVTCEAQGENIMKDFSMHVPHYSLTAVLSKSEILLETVASIIADLYRNYAGEVFYDPKSKVDASEQTRRPYICAPSHFYFDELTVSENIVLAQGARGYPSSKSIEALMKRFHLEDMQNVRLSSLTRPQRRLVSLISALLVEADLLVFIEPLEEIDDEDIESVIYSLLEAKKKTTVLVLSRDYQHIERMADHVVIEQLKKCIIQGPPLSIKNKCKLKNSIEVIKEPRCRLEAVLPYIEPHCSQLLVASDDVLHIQLRVKFKGRENIHDMLSEIEADKTKLKVFACAVADISFVDVLEMLLGTKEEARVADFEGEIQARRLRNRAFNQHMKLSFVDRAQIVRYSFQYWLLDFAAYGKLAMLHFLRDTALFWCHIVYLALNIFMTLPSDSIPPLPFIAGKVYVGGIEKYASTFKKFVEASSLSSGDEPYDWHFIVNFKNSAYGKQIDVDIQASTFTTSVLPVLQGLLNTAEETIGASKVLTFKEIRSPLHVAWQQASSDMPIRLVILVNALCASRLVLNLRFFTQLLEQFSNDHLEISGMRKSAFVMALYCFVFLKDLILVSIMTLFLLQSNWLPAFLHTLFIIVMSEQTLRQLLIAFLLKGTKATILLWMFGIYFSLSVWGQIIYQQTSNWRRTSEIGKRHRMFGLLSFCTPCFIQTSLGMASRSNRLYTTKCDNNIFDEYVCSTTPERVRPCCQPERFCLVLRDCIQRRVPAIVRIVSASIFLHALYLLVAILGRTCYNYYVSWRAKRAKHEQERKGEPLFKTVTYPITNKNDHPSIGREAALAFKELNAWKSQTWPGDIVFKNVGLFDRNFFNFHIASGESICFLGDRKSGRTTILKMIRGEMKPYLGEVLLDGKAPTNENINMFSENYSLPYNFTPFELLKLYARTRGMPGVILDEYCRTLGSVFELIKSMDSPVGTLDSATNRVVAVMLAFVGKPRIVLLDEPTKGLEKTKREVLWKAIGLFLTQVTIVFTTDCFEDCQHLNFTKVAIVGKRKLLMLLKTEELVSTVPRGYVIVVKMVTQNPKDATNISHHIDRVEEYLRRKWPSAMILCDPGNIIRAHVLAENVDSRTLMEAKEALPKLSMVADVFVSHFSHREQLDYFIHIATVQQASADTHKVDRGFR